MGSVPVRPLSTRRSRGSGTSILYPSLLLLPLLATTLGDRARRGPASAEPTARAAGRHSRRGAGPGARRLRQARRTTAAAGGGHRHARTGGTAAAPVEHRQRAGSGSAAAAPAAARGATGALRGRRARTPAEASRRPCAIRPAAKAPAAGHPRGGLRRRGRRRPSGASAGAASRSDIKGRGYADAYMDYEDEPDQDAPPRPTRG